MIWVVLLVASLIVVVMLFQRRPMWNRGGGLLQEDIDAGSEANISIRRRSLFDRRGIRRLTEEDRRGFLRVWHSVYERFENDPRAAVLYADLLMSDLIQDEAENPPGEEHEPEILLDGHLRDKYHTAHAIAIHNKLGPTKTEDLRRAMALYAAVFQKLLHDDTTVAQSPNSEFLQNHWT